MKLTKNQAKPKQHPDAKLLLFENCSLSMLSSKNNIFLQNVQKISASVLMLCDWWQWKWDWKRKTDDIIATQIDLDLDMDTNILNIKCVSI